MIDFNPHKYNFQEISNCIEHFYPLGISKEDDNYFSYPGIQELDQIVVDNIHNKNNYKSRWTDFTNEIENEIQKPVIGTTYGQNPSFSAFIQLETSTMSNLTRTKELNFSVSLVGPFYTIIGQDKNIVNVGFKMFPSTNYLTVSPVDEYEELFKLMADKIENRFKGYRFVPFGIYNQQIEGLQVRYVDGVPNTVFNALFNRNVALTSLRMGDWTYGYDYWIKADFDGMEEEIILLPPDQ